MSPVTTAVPESSLATARERPYRRTVARALGVLAVWAVGVFPLVLGRARCGFAVIMRYPCPGCGMTRATRLLESGHIAASLRMHAFAVPVLVANVAFAIATVWITWRAGSPLLVWKWRFGRRLILSGATLYAALLVYWIARAVGLFGGPVQVALAGLTG